MKAVFLDRDGVLNRAKVIDGKPYPPDSVDTLQVFPGTLEALRQLRNAGFLLIAVTNQPDVARGTTNRQTVEAIHAVLMQVLPLDAVKVCYHDDADACDCRKPSPGMLLEAANEFDVNLSSSYMVGDRWRDVLAGQKAGCRTAWITQGWLEKAPLNPDFIGTSLQEVADWICAQSEVVMERTDDVKYKPA